MGRKRSPFRQKPSKTCHSSVVWTHQVRALVLREHSRPSPPAPPHPELLSSSVCPTQLFLARLLLRSRAHSLPPGMGRTWPLIHHFISAGQNGLASHRASIETSVQGMSDTQCELREKKKKVKVKIREVCSPFIEWVFSF